MNKIRYLFCIAVLFALSALHAQEVPKIRIDPAQTYGGMVSEYFDDIEYIPLETTRESLFGTTNYLIVTDSSIVVGDFDTYYLLFFDLSGKFICKYSVPRERGITVENNKLTKSITASIIPIGGGGKIEKRKYSYRGKLVGEEFRNFTGVNLTTEIPIGDKEEYIYHQATFIPIRKMPVDTTLYLVRIFNKNNEQIKSLMPTKPEENPFMFAYKGGPTFSSDSERKTVYVVIPYDYSIYKLTTDTAELLGQFVFPMENIISPNILKQKDYKLLDSIGKSSSINIKLIESVKNVFFHGQKMFFTLQKRLTVQPSGTEGSVYDPLNYIYDTVSKRLIAIEKFYPTLFSYYLPVIDGFSSKSGMNYQNGCLYSSVSSLRMFHAYEATKSKNPQYPPVLQEYFKTQSRKSNPVIVRMKLRE